MAFSFNPFTGTLDIASATPAYTTIDVDSGTNPVASGVGETLTLTSSDGSIVVSGDAGTDTVTITVSGEFIDDRVAGLIQDGTGITWTYDDVANTLTGNVSLTPFDTDDLSEGLSNLYFTVARARAAAVEDQIVDGVLDIAPSQNAVFDALAQKVDISHTDGGVSKHDASEIDYERLDASKKNIQGTSDDVENALTDLDDATGALQTPTNYTATNDQIVADHLSGINTELADFIRKDGSVTFTANQSMGTFKLTNLADGVDAKDAVNKSQLDNVSSTIENFEWQPSVLDKDITTPPVSPTTGDRYLIGTDTAATAATGAWATHDGEITEWDGSAWVFITPTVGMFVAADDETDRLYLFGGTTWTDKIFESTTASTGLVKSGFDIQIDPSAAGDGLGFTTGVLNVNVDDSTIETTTDTLNVKDGGITDAKAAVGSNLEESVNFFAATDISGAEAETLTDGSDAGSLHNHDGQYVQTSTGDIPETSFSAANNVSVAADVTGLAFNSASVRSAEVHLSVSIDAGTNLYEKFYLELINIGTDWMISQRSMGEESNVDFSVDSTGQVQYTSGNEASFVSSTFKFRAQVTTI